MEGLNPAVNWIQRFKIPRFMAILIVYAVIITAISFSVAGIIPAFVEQSTNLINNLPNAIENFSLWGLNSGDFSSQLKLLENLPSNIATTALSIFSNVLSVFVFFVITFYLLLERDNFDEYLAKIFGKRSPKAIEVVNELEKRLGTWVSAELMLMIIVGVLSYVGYLIIGVNYALPLAIIAGLFEVVPNIGPTVTAILAGLFGLTISPVIGVLGVTWGIIVQQLENNFIVPKIMKETVGINPLITILLIAAGAQLGGIVGAVIAVPLYLTADTIYKTLTK